jgi:hypothetical protein
MSLTRLLPLRFATLPLLGAAGLLAGLLAGCGANMTSIGTGGSGALLQGRVHGGQQPVVGAQIQLYAAGASGYGSAATALIPSGSYAPGGAPGCTSGSGVTCSANVLTDANGNFVITGDYSCPSPGAQVYIVATGGNPGLAAGTQNGKLAMMAALGSCSGLSSSTAINIDEVTTAAAAWALAPFLQSATNLGTSATNATGLANAMLNAQLIANNSTGRAPGATLPAGNTIETAKVYALANSLASCINSDGTSGCNALLSAATPSGGATPADTLQAALNIVSNPGQNVAAVYSAAGSTPVFANALTQAPNDWTLSMTVTSPNLSLPTNVAVDASGNVWTVNLNGPLFEFSPQGALLSPTTGYGSGNIAEAYGLAVDTGGNVWVTDYSGPHRSLGTVVAFQGSNGTTPGALVTQFADNSVANPAWVAADSNGNVFAANQGSYSASEFNTGGEVLQNLGGAYVLASPKTVAIDNEHGIWLNDSDSTISHYSIAGQKLAQPDCCNGSYGLAVDSNDNVWVANNLNSSFSEVSGTGSVLINQSTVGGVMQPVLVAIDGAQNVWFTNNIGSLTEIAGSGSTVLRGTTATLAAGTAISPTMGTYNMGGYGLDANLSGPLGLSLDASGNVWVADYSNNAVVVFFGAATPTKTPAQPGAKLP